MFGAYQAGVWKALEPVFRPDVVIGCSVGSINGWAIAGGISGAELAATWLDPRCATLMRRRLRWRPWQAFFDPEPLREVVRELTATYTPRIPFAVALTRLPQLRIELIETPHVTWRHIAASCAIPAAYPPMRIDGQLYCDGGLLSIMPLWAAARLGADHAIAVNVLPSMPLNLLRASVRMVRLLAPREPEATGVETLRVGPERVMGKLHDAISWDPETIHGWIARGESDGEALINNPRFAAIAGRFV